MTWSRACFQHETIRRMWSRAARDLRRAERVFCVGYSLPQTDITMRFLLESTCRRTGVTLYVVNPRMETLADYKSILGDGYNVDGTHVRADAVQALVQDLVAEAHEA